MNKKNLSSYQRLSPGILNYNMGMYTLVL